MSEQRVTFTDVLRVREFRALWIADTQSAAGDQLARVALSVLVFEKTNSSMLTALAYALTFLPALLGGALLSGLADRYPRRTVMIACDLMRSAAVAAMAFPMTPIWLVCVILVFSVLLTSPFNAAESALVPDILADDRYVVGTGLRTITSQLAQLAGFGGGGIIIAAIGPRAGLAVDSVTFLLSGLLLSVALKRRPAVRSSQRSVGQRTENYRAAVAAGFRYVARKPKLRVLLGLAWLAGLWVIPEGVAPAYAAQLGGGARAVGFLMAAAPAGTALGAYLFVRLVKAESRRGWMRPLAAGTGLPLLACAFKPGLAVSLLLLFISGVCMAYQIEVVANYVRSVPDELRGRAVGIAASGLTAVQGLGVLAGGAVANVWDARTSIVVAGGLGAVLACWFATRSTGSRSRGIRTRSRTSTTAYANSI